jgi:hypothetical protein
MRNSIKFGGAAVFAVLMAASVASAQTVIQPQYQAGGGSGQSFVYQPGATASANSGARSSTALSGMTQGPVTGYGAGGLAHEPGTVTNPPYFRGGMGAGKR